MSALLAVAADLLVAVLLAATIATSLRLSRRIRGLKADEAAMRSTVAELAAAADTAERAIAALRITVAESERSLGEKLRLADERSGELENGIAAARLVVDRVEAIADISRRVFRDAAPERTAPKDRAEAVRSAGSIAESVLAGLARRVEGRAA